MLKKLFDPSRKELKKYERIAHQVFALEEEMKQLSDDQLRAKTDEFRRRHQNGETLDELLVEAFLWCEKHRRVF